VAFDWTSPARDGHRSASQRVRDFMVKYDMPIATTAQCTNTVFSTLMQVDVVGFGCILIKRKVLEKMIEMHGPKLFGGHGNDFGEDTVWCKLAQDAGFKIYVDLGAQIGHIAQSQITVAHFMQVDAWEPKEK